MPVSSSERDSRPVSVLYNLYSQYNWSLQLIDRFLATHTLWGYTACGTCEHADLR